MKRKKHATSAICITIKMHHIASKSSQSCSFKKVNSFSFCVGFRGDQGEGLLASLNKRNILPQKCRRFKWIVSTLFKGCPIMCLFYSSPKFRGGEAWKVRLFNSTAHSIDTLQTAKYFNCLLGEHVTCWARVSRKTDENHGLLVMKREEEK